MLLGLFFSLAFSLLEDFSLGVPLLGDFLYLSCLEVRASGKSSLIPFFSFFSEAGAELMAHDARGFALSVMIKKNTKAFSLLASVHILLYLPTDL